ncbi:MAG: class E sortase, partial [Acidimicrobiales bacterium]
GEAAPPRRERDRGDPDEVAAAALAGASARAAAAQVEPAPVVPPEHSRLDLAGVLSAAGRTLIALGLLVLGFVAFELLGTNVAEARNQSTLREDFKPPPPPVDLPVSQPLPDQPAPPPPPVGSAVAVLRIPRVGLDKAVVEGVDLSDLRKGPGHYAGTPLPGQPGNAAIAGHRTTYGAPFFRLDEMKPGDPIFVSTLQGAFRYEVTKVFVVKPSEVEVLNPTTGNQLTLTTCNPRFSAAQRLVVVADLKGPAAAPAPRAPTANPNPAVAATQAPPIAQEVVGASGDPAERAPAALWATVLGALAIAGALLGRLWRRWPARIVMAAPFLAALWTFYGHLARAVPS